MTGATVHGSTDKETDTIKLGSKVKDQFNKNID